MNTGDADGHEFKLSKHTYQKYSTQIHVNIFSIYQCSVPVRKPDLIDFFNGVRATPCGCTEKYKCTACDHLIVISLGSDIHADVSELTVTPPQVSQQPLFFHIFATQKSGGVTGFALKRSRYGSFTIFLSTRSLTKMGEKKKRQYGRNSVNTW